MCGVYCEICRYKLPSMKILLSHYLCKHSKFKLAREILKLSVFKSTPKILYHRNKFRTGVRSRNKKTTIDKAETLFISDNIHILYRNNEIIIRDDKNTVDMEFSFDENSCDSKDFSAKTNEKTTEYVNLKNNNYDVDLRDCNNSIETEYRSNNKVVKKKQFGRQNYSEVGLQTSSSSTSPEESLRKFAFRKKIKKRRDTREKSKQYKINITKLKNNESLNEITGNFYHCACRDDNRKNNTILDSKITSDTESASETSKSNLYNPKVFCSKCGNGYSEESMLIEHMKIHETHCRVCNEIFPTEQSFKQHIQSHIFKVFVCHICSYESPVKAMLHKHFDYHVEESILESVIDMENDYNLTPCPLPSMTYQTSINNILFYLGETHDM